MQPQSTTKSRLAGIALTLKHYEDIFSSFDARPYAERALSVDFLDEVKRAARDKDDGGIALILLLPDKRRDKQKEEVIKERLTAHFNRHYRRLSKERWGVIRFGAQMAAVGILLMLAATYFLFSKSVQDFLLWFLNIILEIVGWFMLWEGSNQIMFQAREFSPDLGFYHKLAGAHILFHSS